MSGGNPGLDPATQGTTAQGMLKLRAFADDLSVAQNPRSSFLSDVNV